MISERLEAPVISMELDENISFIERHGIFLLGIANSGASRIAERYVARSPGISGLLLLGYSSRYLGLTTSICRAITVLCGPLTMLRLINQALKTERRFIISRCCSEVTSLPKTCLR